MEIAECLGTSVVTVAKWIGRYEEGGLAALESRKSPGRPREVSAEERARIIALTRQSPPAHTGLSHWSSHEMARYLKRHEGIDVAPAENPVHAGWSHCTGEADVCAIAVSGTLM